MQIRKLFTALKKADQGIRSRCPGEDAFERQMGKKHAIVQLILEYYGLRPK
jgi:hypothetical protein|nr:hypothetical protein LRH_06486 [Lacticaseibacillus rhamnosus HN001]